MPMDSESFILVIQQKPILEFKKRIESEGAIGALYCRRALPRVPIIPIIDGGGHERGLRSGTLNVPGIVGFAKAVEISIREMKAEQKRIRTLRDNLLEKLKTALPDINLNVHPLERLPGNLNICFPGVESEALIIALTDEVAVSSGAACTTSAVEPSHVLKAIGLKDEDIHSSIRIGLGRFNSEEEIKFSAESIIREANRLRGLRASTC